MACFTAPVAEAIVTTIVEARLKHKEKTVEDTDDLKVKIPFSRKIGWLNKMLWGGSALLAFEHVWHGEVTPYFPFLTAATDAADRAAMFREIATTGVAMAAVVTAVWGLMLAACHIYEKKASAALAESK